MNDDIEIILEKVLDGYPLLYHLASGIKSEYTDVWVLMVSYDHEGSDLIACCETEEIVERAFNQYVEMCDDPRYGWKDISVQRNDYGKAIYSDVMGQTIHYFKIPLNKIRTFIRLKPYEDIK